MTFAAGLNSYIERAGCSGAALSQASGLSPAVISRYRSGRRQPGAESAQLHRLCAAIAALGNAAGRDLPGGQEIWDDLHGILLQEDVKTGRMVVNLNALISMLDINIAEMARFLGCDASYISRIRSGRRSPADAGAFAGSVSGYIVRRYTSDNSRAVTADLIGCPLSCAADDNSLRSALCGWLLNGSASGGGYTEDFLRKLDDFDLDEYIRSIHYDELKVTSMPFRIPASKTYYGVEGIKTGLTEFFKNTALLKAAGPVVMYSDMPMVKIDGDSDFSRKWMYGIAMILKRGMHLSLIHDLDRPFGEMMLALENWIPMYMSGQISPYYLNGVQNNVFCHAIMSSGSCACSGKCISGDLNGGSIYVTNSRDEVAYYNSFTQSLLQKAHPLMDIYRDDRAAAFNAFMSAEEQESGNWQTILSAPPLYTIPQDELKDLLSRSGVSDDDSGRITAFFSSRRDVILKILEHSDISVRVPELTREEFDRHPPALPLSGLFFEQKIIYTYEEYRRHMAATADFAAAHSGYTLLTCGGPALCNIQFTVREGKWVMVSKDRSPAIHFVIRHPKLCAAIENMFIPDTEI